ncbi:antitoxin CptB [Salinihabitans flavidus]|uniref:FAD assembly factor SdhE n=2 Tax=Salinihabitans flavidus TaxID=569882 RepID=A0A1H8V4A2_9RHOB|nr:antitoxin CptB [Salinihabitans flavidus]
MRRGIKEMDIILSRFAGARLDAMNNEALDLYEALLGESDHDLYQWVSGQASPPQPYEALIGQIAAQISRAQ